MRGCRLRSSRRRRRSPTTPIQRRIIGGRPNTDASAPLWSLPRPTRPTPYHVDIRRTSTHSLAHSTRTLPMQAVPSCTLAPHPYLQEPSPTGRRASSRRGIPSRPNDNPLPLCGMMIPPHESSLERHKQSSDDPFDANIQPLGCRGAFLASARAKHPTSLHTLTQQLQHTPWNGE